MRVTKLVVLVAVLAFGFTPCAAQAAASGNYFLIAAEDASGGAAVSNQWRLVGRFGPATASARSAFFGLSSGFLGAADTPVSGRPWATGVKPPVATVGGGTGARVVRNGTPSRRGVERRHRRSERDGAEPLGGSDSLHVPRRRGAGLAVRGDHERGRHRAPRASRRCLADGRSAARDRVRSTVSDHLPGPTGGRHLPGRGPTHALDAIDRLALPARLRDRSGLDHRHHRAALRDESDRRVSSRLPGSAPAATARDPDARHEHGSIALRARELHQRHETPALNPPAAPDSPEAWSCARTSDDAWLPLSEIPQRSTTGRWLADGDGREPASGIRCFEQSAHRTRKEARSPC